MPISSEYRYSICTFTFTEIWIFLCTWYKLNDKFRKKLEKVFPHYSCHTYENLDNRARIVIYRVKMIY